MARKKIEKVTERTPDMIPQGSIGIKESYQDPRRALERRDFELMPHDHSSVSNLPEKEFIRALKGY